MAQPSLSLKMTTACYYYIIFHATALNLMQMKDFTMFIHYYHYCKQHQMVKKHGPSMLVLYLNLLLISCT